MNEIIMTFQIDDDSYRIVTDEMDISLERSQESGWEYVDGDQLDEGNETEYEESIKRLVIAGFGDHNARGIFHS